MYRLFLHPTRGQTVVCLVSFRRFAFGGSRCHARLTSSTIRLSLCADNSSGDGDQNLAATPSPTSVHKQPTNHLDLASIDALKNALEGYGGGVILASHDQALISDMLDEDEDDSGLPRAELWEVKGHRVSRREEGGGIALYLEELTALAEKREARRRAAAGR